MRTAVPLTDMVTGLYATIAIFAALMIWHVRIDERRIAARRGIDTAAVEGLEQGRVFSGREAVRLKLVDEIGGESEAVKWLETKRGVPKNLKVVDWKPKPDLPWSLSGALAGLIADTAAALGATIRRSSEDNAFGRLSLDGLVSVWHPSEN